MALARRQNHQNWKCWASQRQKRQPEISRLQTDQAVDAELHVALTTRVAALEGSRVDRNDVVSRTEVDGMIAVARANDAAAIASMDAGEARMDEREARLEAREVHLDARIEAAGEVTFEHRLARFKLYRSNSSFSNL
ncbi:hypothetical protein PG994_000905 [Apiospora phragmitis]|uniref:Uncharacterized protein n=1 Tax=Apiospora phragmitis TaxID=2905665 RepID=A0ABR1WQW6_9PEZI